MKSFFWKILLCLILVVIIDWIVAEATGPQHFFRFKQGEGLCIDMHNLDNRTEVVAGEGKQSAKDLKSKINSARVLELAVSLKDRIDPTAVHSGFRASQNVEIVAEQ